MPGIRRPLPLSNPRPRHPTTSAPDATPGSEPNSWDPVRKPGHGSYTPDGNAIYSGSSGFEELKDRAVVSATIEFLDCGLLPSLLPAPAPAPTEMAAASLSPLATASSSSSAAAAPPSSSFTPINPRVPASPAAVRSSSPAETDSDDSDEYVETSSSSSKRKRCGGDQPFRTRKRSNDRQQPRHKNHVVLRLQIEGTVDVSLPGKRCHDCSGVIVSVEESSSQDNRCYVACKPISYREVTRSAAAAFTFDVLEREEQMGKREKFTLRDVLRVCEEGGLLPFRYASLGMAEGGVALEVGCRDWMTQLFCRLHQAGYVSWHASHVHPDTLTGKGFPATGNKSSFAHVIRHRYSGIRRQKGLVNAKFPFVEPLPIIPGHFAREAGDDEDEGGEVIRWEEYNGEKLGYQGPEDMLGGRQVRRSSRLAALADQASLEGEETGSG